MSRRRVLAGPDLPEQVVATPDAFRACLEHLRTTDCIGLDTEFVGEESYRPELCLIQVATPSRLLLIDPYSCGDLTPFWTLMLDPNRVVVVHAGREEVRMCWYAIGKPPAAIFDVQIASALVGYTYPIGYAGLVQEAIGARASKAETLTDWRRRPLSVNQIRYAYDDVRYLLPLWRGLSERLVRWNRTTWAAEEFEAFVRHSILDDPSIEKWRKLKGLGGLNRRELAVAREVFVWREQFAARLNRPPRVLLRDDIVIEIARRGSGRHDDLHTLRGLPRGEGDAILFAVRRGHELPLDQCPATSERDSDAPHINTLASLLGVVLSEFCARMKLASNLVATTYDLKSLVRARQPGAKLADDSSFISGWRSQEVRPHLDAVLDGTQVIRVSNPGSANPITIHPISPNTDISKTNPTEATDE